MGTTVRLHKLVDILVDILGENANANIGYLIDPLSPSDIARLLESLPGESRTMLWDQVSGSKMAEVLLEVHGEIRRLLVGQTDQTKLIESLSTMQMDELADLDEDLPVPVVNAMVESMDDQRKQRYALVRDYPDDTAGGMMDVDATVVRADVTLKSVFRYLRRLRSREDGLAEHLDSLMVVDRNNSLRGLLPLSDLVSLDLDTAVGDVMLETVVHFTPLQSSLEVAREFADRDLMSAPVVDSKGYLLGRITVDDVIDVMRDETDRYMLLRAGLNPHEDMFGPVMRSSLRRAFWLGINLVTAFVAAWVIGLFAASIEKVVALAVLMPVVASMGGVAGSQTLTLVTRGIALDQIGQSNFYRLVRHELQIGVLNGLFWAAVVAVIAYLWFSDWLLGVVFGAALLAVVVTGALAGAVIPVVLKWLGIDPALAGGVVLTTATDVVGFSAFLGIATLVIL